MSDKEPAQSGIPRPVEAAVALMGLIAVSPVIALAAVAVILTTGLPVLFRQNRVGRRGRTFILYKLRTMKSSTDGPQVTARDDRRVTLVGKLLRRTKLDELPELWNVVRGDMSLVGPRPEVPRYVNRDNPAWLRVLSVRPGLTDPTTLRLRDEETLLSEVAGDLEQYYERVLQPAKLKGYIDYIEKRTWRSDVRVLLSTLLAILPPRRNRTPDINEIESAS
jgi:lipopolysaccharide/colanic/teichoic acid biosynthesis glycosyltransferase